MVITLTERLGSGVWSITPTGITGGTLSLAQQPWTPIGATDQGWTWAAAKTLQDITIEEQTTLVNRLVTQQTMTVSGALSEDISSTLAIVYNMTNATTAATSTNPAYETLTLTDNPVTYAVALIMANKYTFPRWLYIPQATCLANVSAVFRRAAAKRMYAAEFSSICQTNLIQVINIIAPHT
jgi:hypothetical protein